MTHLTQTTLGELISAFYEEFLAAYGDPHIASRGTALLLERLLDGVSA